jgi:ferredoxin-like protein FixX|tara:strand:- start:855 stop:1556 length:702 start_codon:yes stop_codon:yes gene_type:complete
MSNDMTTYLEGEGINLFAVIDLAGLPTDVRAKVAACTQDLDAYSQLLLYGHAGRRFWERLTESEKDSSNRFDEKSVRLISAGLERFAKGSPYKILYPGIARVPLQDLGRLSGWHHDSPLGLGIHPTFGLWFAYRGVVLSETTFNPTIPLRDASPCLSCDDDPCISACPAKVLSHDGFDVNKCVSYRLEQASNCASKCIARIACPVTEHRYAEEQMTYHYSHSLATIKHFSKSQ